MSWLKLILMLLLSVSIAGAGLPAQAKPPECPMAKMMRQMAMLERQDTHDCDGCPKAEEQQNRKQSGCCDDTACNLQCSMSSGISMSDASKVTLPHVTRQTPRSYLLDAALASRQLNTQERPPKSLS